MKKIEKVSKFFYYFFIFLILFLPLADFILWMTGKELGFLTPIDNFIGGTWVMQKNYGSLIFIQKVLAFVVDLIPITIQVLVLCMLVKLFSLYRESIIFSAKNVKYIRNIGYLILLGQCLNPLHEALLSLVLTYRNPVGERLINVSIGSTDIALVCFGFLLILISWIMNEGKKLQEEQEKVI